MDLSDNAAHILIVDDDRRIRDRLAQYLFENGFRATTANDATCARASMRGLAFDLVLLDVMMPGESGLDPARELKTTSNVPICILTARAEAEHRVEGLEIGVDDFVPKPFEPRELVLRLRNILKHGRGWRGWHALSSAVPTRSMLPTAPMKARRGSWGDLGMLAVRGN